MLPPASPVRDNPPGWIDEITDRMLKRMPSDFQRMHSRRRAPRKP